MCTDDSLISFGVSNSVKRYSETLQLNQLPEIQYVTSSEIRGFIGSAGLVIIENDLKYYIQIDRTDINQNEIDNHNSQTQGIIYHELCHLQNIQQLCNNIPMDLLIQEFTEWKDVQSASYQMAFMLWGEYYAYKRQFEKFSYHSPAETQLLQNIKMFCDDIVKGNHLLDKQQSLHRKYMDILRQDVYNILYDITEYLAYDSLYSNTNILSKCVEYINEYLHIDISAFVEQMKHGLNILWESGAKNITLSELSIFGDTLWEIFELLEFDVSFMPELEISFGQNQPLMRFAYK